MTDISHLISCVESLPNGRVLCVGDIMLDRFVYGDVERISPEAPIPVFRILNENAMLGGAGNVARNLVGLGAGIDFFAVVGDDPAGREVTALIGNLDGLDARLITDRSRKTSIKTRYIASNQQMMRADEETVAAIDDLTRTSLIDGVKFALEDCAAMVLADYGKGVLTGGIAGELIELARARGVPVIVDPQGQDYTKYMGASLVTPNRKELADATGMDTGNGEEIIAAAAQLARLSGIEAVLATRSADGMTLVRNANNYAHFEAEAREVFDVSGAGDTVVAIIAAAIAAGVSMEDAVSLANVAAGIVVGKVGTAVAYASDLIDALHHQEMASGEAKVLSLNSGYDRAQIWRSKGYKVGFTNGCFDLLHPGHLAVLSQAKAACDRLIVGLNSDSSTKRLKGKDRPVQSETARAAVLTSLEYVDLVLIFSEDTPAKIIETIKPEVFVKGADYTIDQIPEAKIVAEYGGETILAQLAEGHSTTATIARMAKEG